MQQPTTLTVYHSELRKRSPLQLIVKSGVMNSKKKPGKKLVILTIDGIDRYYEPESAACEEALQNLQGKQVVLIADGMKDGATLEAQSEPTWANGPIENERTHQHQIEQTLREPVEPKEQDAFSQAVKEKPIRVHGAVVGCCLKEAVGIAKEIGIQPRTPEFNRFIWQVSSDLIRVYQSLEEGKLAAKPNPKPASN